ncbi:MAG: NAD(P)-binding protein [Rhodospirillaceae bacterium]|nr:NAD(P)-binding protein [Rhodospirillaceae bacterium]MBT4589215.1 NAD(P)-binding protein [Rhodospirillaceae bacterium]
MPHSDHNAGTVYIIGAGMAGLSAAVSCIQKGWRVALFEAANHAGGRCRSYEDSVLGRTIDNGNHLILSGNNGIKTYLEMVDGLEGFEAVDPVSFEFIDMDADESWALSPSAGRIPWWVLLPSKRIPGTNLTDYLALSKLQGATTESLAGIIDPTRPIFERFWQPLCHAVLNTDANEGSAASIWAMLSETLLKGREASRPMLAKNGLSAALVDPAVSYLTANKAAPQFSTRLRALKTSPDSVQSIMLNDQEITLNAEDRVILALPPNEISALLPDITVPTETRAIVNVHFRLEYPPPLPNNVPFIGMIGSTSQWLFKRGDVYSVTISAADELAENTADEIAATVWQEVAKVIGRDGSELPPVRVIKEQRATIAQTPAQNELRPDSPTKWQNLFLAGDWTKTGLPATIESAVVSGQKAAELL